MIPHASHTPSDPPALQVRAFKKGETILHKGQEMLHTSIVLRGDLQLITDSALPPATVGAGSLLCESMMFLADGTRTEGMTVAATDGLLLNLNFDAIMEIAFEDHLLALKIFKMCGVAAVHNLRGDLGRVDKSEAKLRAKMVEALKGGGSKKEEEGPARGEVFLRQKLAKQVPFRRRIDRACHT